MIPRHLKALINDDKSMRKISLILGPRQVGKTTLLEDMKQGYNRVLSLNCDNADEAQLLVDKSSTSLRAMLDGYDMVQIDEAQRMRDIGLILKKIGDLHLPATIMVTGSSSLELARGIYDSAVGRVWNYTMYPISLSELADANGPVEETLQLERRLIYGLYPEVVMHPEKEQQVLLQIYNQYLYRDILAFQGLKKPEVLLRLVQTLALQVGSEVSFNELSRELGIDKVTIERYIDLLEKCFIVFRLSSYSRNMRNEIKKGKKIYFYDNGIRNAAIGLFSPPNLRNDVGALWENLMVSERIKRNHYARAVGNLYFWRTTDNRPQEVDLIEERNGEIYAYEMKWKPGKRVNIPSLLSTNYKVAHFEVITPNNFWPFVRP